MPRAVSDLDVDVDPSQPAQPRMRRRGERATWEIVAILIVLAVILVLATPGRRRDLPLTAAGARTRPWRTVAIRGRASPRASGRGPVGGVGWFRNESGRT
jgi:hypothetical protein